MTSGTPEGAKIHRPCSACCSSHWAGKAGRTQGQGDGHMAAPCACHSQRTWYTGMLMLSMSVQLCVYVHLCECAPPGTSDTGPQHGRELLCPVTPDGQSRPLAEH